MLFFTKDLLLRKCSDFYFAFLIGNIFSQDRVAYMIIIMTKSFNINEAFEKFPKVMFLFHSIQSIWLAIGFLYRLQLTIYFYL